MNYVTAYLICLMTSWAGLICNDSNADFAGAVGINVGAYLLLAYILEVKKK